MRLASLALSSLALFVAGCALLDEAPGAPPAAVLFHGGTIHLDASGAPPVHALLAVDGRVEVVGGAALRAAERCGDGLVRVDLGGATAIPGLYDAHAHLEGIGESLESVDLRGCGSQEELVARVAAQAARQPAGTWVTGRGWDHTLFTGRAFPEHGPLSQAVPAHPVFVRRVDGHAGLANALALELAGVPERPGDDGLVPGGRIHLDPDGRPTGVLVDRAMGLVRARIPAADRETRRRRQLLAQDELLTKGLVGVHDMGVPPSTIALLEELEREGRWSLRVAVYLWGNDGLDETTLRTYPRPGDLDPGRRVRVVGVKLMADGALGSRGAALLEDYADAPGERGLPILDDATLAARIEACADAGLQPAVHAIGDRANRAVLDAYERRIARGTDFAALRPRVEHAQVVAEADWPRFDRLGAIASVQPTHATSDMRWAGERLGDERLRGAYAWRRLAADPSRLALGSDAPVEDPSPLLGLYAARTRADASGGPPGGFLPEQRLTPLEALAGFTSGAAFAAHEEHARGRLVPGYRCDLVLLDVDPLSCAAPELLAARVLLVAIDGAVVHDAR